VIGTRALLVAASGASIVGFAGAIASEAGPARGGAASVLPGVFATLLGLGAIAAVAVSFLHAHRQDRSGVAWAVGALLFPYAAPLVLAALPAAGGVTVAAAEGSAALRSALAGKWICQCGTVRDGAHEGDRCPVCDGPLLRFVAAEPGQRCAGCGFLFSDAPIGVDDRMSDVWSRKGFRCSACGDGVCVSCMVRDETGDPTHRCGCGGALAIRL